MKTDFLSDIIARKKKDVEIQRKKIPVEKLIIMAGETGKKRPFYSRLVTPGKGGANIIAEIKRASPSKGIIRENLDAAKFAKAYEKGGAAAISVLTDAPYFHGSLDDMKTARKSSTIPVLRKEFIVTRYQVYESAAAGADAILLIARILDQKILKRLVLLCQELGMEALVEIHSLKDLKAASYAGATLIGINNRNLATFKTDIKIAMDLAKMLEPGQIAVAASGITGPYDIKKNLEFGVFNFLIGESIVRSKDPAKFIQGLMPHD